MGDKKIMADIIEAQKIKHQQLAARITELEKELCDAKYLLFRAYDRLWTSSPDSAKVLEVQRILKDVRHPAGEAK